MDKFQLAVNRCTDKANGWIQFFNSWTFRVIFRVNDAGNFANERSLCIQHVIIAFVYWYIAL